MRKEAIVKSRKPLSVLVCCSLVLLVLLFLRTESIVIGFFMLIASTVAVGICLNIMGLSFRDKKRLVIFKLRAGFDAVVSILVMGLATFFLHIHFGTELILQRFALFFVLYSVYILASVLLLRISLRLLNRSKIDLLYLAGFIVGSCLMAYVSQSTGSASASMGLYYFGHYFFALSLILFLAIVFERIYLLLKDEHSQTNCKLEIRRY